MPDEKEGVTVDIFGHEYKIRGDADPGYILEIAQYVDGKMKEVAHGAPAGSLTKIAILAALNIAEELFRERTEKQKYVQDVETSTRRMRRKLEELVP
ncbi:MAG TPA: cell division protein ZapA [bacterium]|nr:cell division protein ZapA [bacterium]